MFVLSSGETSKEYIIPRDLVLTCMNTSNPTSRCIDAEHEQVHIGWLLGSEGSKLYESGELGGATE